MSATITTDNDRGRQDTHDERILLRASRGSENPVELQGRVAEETLRGGWSESAKRQWKYYKKNRAKVLARRKQYRESHKAELSAKFKAWAEANKERQRVKGARRRKENPAKMKAVVKACHKKGRAELKDWYIKHQILRTKANLPTALMEAKRAQMKVKRLCRNLQT